MAGIENNILYGGGVKLEPSSSRDISDMQGTSVDVSRINHTGNPEGVISANPSSLSHDPTTGALYLKVSGTGNTGWVQVPTSAATTCLFSAYRSSTASDVTGDGTVYTIPFDTALVNLGAAYNTGTGVFTAPTTANYLFQSTVNVSDLQISHAEGIFGFVGSAFESRFARYNMGAMATAGVFSASGSLVVPLTAGQTMSVFAFATGGSKVVDVIGAASPAIFTNFSGYLIP
jgi:hypothetical protein